MLLHDTSITENMHKRAGQFTSPNIAKRILIIGSESITSREQQALERDPISNTSY